MPLELIWVLPAVLALVDWYAVARDDRRTERWAKPAVLTSLMVTALVLGAAGSGTGWWLLVALFFGLLGDIALLSDTVPRFKAGVVAFLVGHLAYVACFVALGLPRPAWAWLGLVPLAVALVATRGVVPGVNRAAGGTAATMVAAYSGVIGAMLVTAWLTGEPLVALGATIFVASDSILSIDRFVRPLPHARLVLMVTYHVGQALIVLGVLATV